MRDHHFDTLNQHCLGCDISMEEFMNGAPHASSPRCPSTATLINDEKAGIMAVIVAPDRLIISDGAGVLLRLGAAAGRALINAAVLGGLK